MVKLDPELNIEELIQAAEAGNAKAQTHLGWCYDEGDGVKKCYKKAVEYYTKAAELGYPKARQVLKKWDSGK